MGVVRNAPRAWLCLVAVALFTFTYLHFSPSSLSTTITDRRGGQQQHGNSLAPLDSHIHHNENIPSLPSPPPPPPNITIIAIWNPKKGSPPQPYLPNFFASVGANAPLVHLLFIVFDKHNYGCDKRISPLGMTNVQEVCFETHEYWSLHVDYLCRYWKCSKEEETKLLRVLIERGEDDFLNSYFRPFRAGVFAKWLDPQTPLWGWCDMDTMLGNFARKFPWEIMNQFDLMIPAFPSDTDHIMLFMSGHLMFFRHEARVMEEFFNFGPLRSVQTFLATPKKWIDPGAEEAEYSHFALLNTNLTFIHFGALIWTQHHISTAGKGVFAVDHGDYLPLPDGQSEIVAPAKYQAVREYITSLVHENTRTPPTPFFTHSGGEYTVSLHSGKFPQGTWIPASAVVHFDPDYTNEVYSRVRRDSGVRSVMRRAVNGPVTERIEPTQYIVTRPMDDLDGTKEGKDGRGQYNRDTRPYLIEYLYNHYQGEKWSPWWSLPERALKPGEILLINKDRGAEVWDEHGTPWWSHWTKPSASKERRHPRRGAN